MSEQEKNLIDFLQNEISHAQAEIDRAFHAQNECEAMNFAMGKNTAYKKILFKLNGVN